MAAESALDNLRTAISRAERHAAEARTKLRRCEEAVEHAKKTQADAIAATALAGEEIEPQTALREAENALADARNDHQAARDALAGLHGAAC